MSKQNSQVIETEIETEIEIKRLKYYFSKKDIFQYFKQSNTGSLTTDIRMILMCYHHQKTNDSERKVIRDHLAEIRLALPSNFFESEPEKEEIKSFVEKFIKGLKARIKGNLEKPPIDEFERLTEFEKFKRGLTVRNFPLINYHLEKPIRLENEIEMLLTFYHLQCEMMSSEKRKIVKDHLINSCVALPESFYQKLPELEEIKSFVNLFIKDFEQMC